MSVDDYEERPVFGAGKRLGVQWCPWMDDWFTSWSPRNGNSHAEGPWDQWVDLALMILHDPLTAKVRPEAQAAVADVKPIGFYDEARTHLTEDDLAERFPS